SCTKLTSQRGTVGTRSRPAGSRGARISPSDSRTPGGRGAGLGPIDSRTAGSRGARIGPIDSGAPGSRGARVGPADLVANGNQPPPGILRRNLVDERARGGRSRGPPPSRERRVRPAGNPLHDR